MGGGLNPPKSTVALFAQERLQVRPLQQSTPGATPGLAPTKTSGLFLYLQDGCYGMEDILLKDRNGKCVVGGIMIILS